MNDTTGLLLSVCALLLVGGGLVALVILVGVRLGWRWLRGLPAGAVGALGGMVRDEMDDVDSPAYRTQSAKRRAGLKGVAADLDFDAAVARHAKDQIPPDPDDPPMAQRLNTNPPSIESPVTGRIMRDGRYRRMTGGTPGREQDQDFRRVGDEEPLTDFKDDLPPARPLRNKRRKRRDRNQDELFGGMLDEDGDGDLDFLA